MKRFLTIVAALALVLGLSQCRKPNAPIINGIGGTQHVVLQASFDNGGSKIAEDGIGGLKWAIGDIITVRKDGEPLNPGTLTCTNAENGTFEGDIATATGKITFTFGTQNLKLKEQTGELNDAISLTSGEVEYNPSGSYKDVNMTMAQENAILKLDLHGLVSSIGDVTITAVASAKGEAETVAKVLNVSTTPKDMYVMIPVAGTPAAKDYTFTGDAGSYTIKNKTRPIGQIAG